MPRHLGQSVSDPPDLRPLIKWILISVVIHAVFFTVTSIGFIARGFKSEAEVAAKPAVATAPALAAPAAPIATTPSTDKPSSALPAVPKPKSADAEYFKDEKPPTAEELKAGPSLEIE